MKKIKTNKGKISLWSALADWYLTDGKRLRDKIAYDYLIENNLDHQLMKELQDKWRKDNFITPDKTK